MLPEAKHEDLLYVGQSCGGVCILTYPSGRFVGMLGVWPTNLCADKKGNVFLTVANGSDAGFVYEYAHGSTQSKRTLTVPGDPMACSVDPVTGNLAVANWNSQSDPSNGGNIAVYQNAKGSPEIYDDSKIPHYKSCAFDGSSNLFAVGYMFGQDNSFVELPRGGNQLESVTINQSFPNTQSILWDGKYLAIGGTYSTAAITQVSVAGSTGTVVGTTSLRRRKSYETPIRQFWINNDVVIAPIAAGRGTYEIGFWPYPAGGQPIKIWTRHQSYWGDVTISVAK